jgi:GNAT superfamily N-acetyltransferase
LTSVKASEADILRDGFGPTPRFECLLVEAAGRPAGFALYFHNYSTWEGRAGIYVEDIFVSEWARGRNIGRLLLAAISALAEARGCTRVDLSAALESGPRFHERIGLVEMSEWRPYWLWRRWPHWRRSCRSARLVTDAQALRARGRRADGFTRLLILGSRRPSPDGLKRRSQPQASSSV